VAEALTEAETGRLLDALCSRHRDLGLRRSRGSTVDFSVEEYRLELELAPPLDQTEPQIQARAGERLAQHPRVALVSRVEGKPEQDHTWAAIEAALASIAENFPALATLTLDAEIGGQLVADPIALLPNVVAAREAWIERRWAPRVAGLPPCLALELRPRELDLPLARPLAPTGPCMDCSHAMVCPANAVEGGSREGLRPLRHREPTTGLLTALRTMSEAWRLQLNPATSRWVDDARTRRRGVLSAPILPFELSLKRTGSRLAPLVRIVDIFPPTPTAWPTAAQRSASYLEALRASVPAFNTELEIKNIETFLDLVCAERGAGASVSYGIEAPLGEGSVRTQLYAHLPRGQEGQALVRKVLSWAGAEAKALELAMTFCAAHQLALVTLAPLPDEPRRVKIYVSAPLSTCDPSTGLEPLDPVPSYAPTHGLAVLACGAQGLAWEKWDFRCMAHFQTFAPVLEDFVAGLDPVDEARARRILNGLDFAPWPTWISVRPHARTLYFSPR